MRSSILTGHCWRSLSASPRLDEFQTHPLGDKRASPPHGVPAHLFPSAMILFGNVTVSGLSSGTQVNQPKPADDRLPARTTPPTSLFLPMHLSNSEGSNQPKPIRCPNPQVSSDTLRSLTEPEFHRSPHLDAVERTENPPSPPLSREERVREVPKPTANPINAGP